MRLRGRMDYFVRFLRVWRCIAGVISFYRFVFAGVAWRVVALVLLYCRHKSPRLRAISSKIISYYGAVFLFESVRLVAVPLMAAALFEGTGIGVVYC